MELTHFDSKGDPLMVDISEKNETRRVALSYGKIKVSKETMKIVRTNKVKKGNVIQTAIIGGILGAKSTSSLIPLTHPIPIDNVKIKIEEYRNELHVFSLCVTTYKTGIEMEAIVSTGISLFTIYDMIKSIEKSAVISEIKLLYKSGGKGGYFISEELKGRLKYNGEQKIPLSRRFFSSKILNAIPEGFYAISKNWYGEIIVYGRKKYLKILKGKPKKNDEYVLLPELANNNEIFS